MKKELIEIINHLDGFVRAIASIEGLHGDSIANAFIEKLEKDDIAKSLSKLYKELTESSSEYEFGKVSVLDGRELETTLEKQLLRRPFNIEGGQDLETVKSARFNIVFKIIDLISIAREESKSKNQTNYCVDMYWNNPGAKYSGLMFVFPFDDKAIFLKIISLEV